MKTKIASLIHDRAVRIAGLTLASILTFSMTGEANVPGETDPSGPLAVHDHVNAAPVSARLLDIVRLQTRPFVNVNDATAAGYQPLFGCISGPEIGAMGVHYINLTLVGDGEVDATKPEALIYEPSSAGMRLVGVEYIVDAAAWDKNHPAPPMLEGQGFQLVTSPNRYGLAPFYELHVWAWRDNPHGSFVDWNPRVSCDRQ
jgi:hypothetical protein